MKEAGLRPEDLDYVGFYDKPLLKFERLLETYLAFAPAGFKSFLTAMPIWLKKKLHLSREMRRGLSNAYKKRFVFTEHHESHAASAFFPSPFEEAAILTVDGVGEWATASFGTRFGVQSYPLLTHEDALSALAGHALLRFHLLYCGFKVNSGEYNLMGLAALWRAAGAVRRRDSRRQKLIDLKDDGSFRMDMSYFNYCQGLTMTSKKFDRLFGGPPRAPETLLTQRDMDLAASIQVVIEEIMLRMARHVHAETGRKNLCLAGGVALNCVANGRILREGPFDELWIQPAAGDAGGALGVAQFIWHQLLDQPRTVNRLDAQRGSYLGPQFADDEIRQFLDRVGARYRYIENEDELCDTVAGLIANEKVIGWLQGRMEFGPRALGSRSILGDARSEQMQSTMNLKIKFRESFRPFAPSVLQERVGEYFETRPNEPSPYMLLVAPVRKEKRFEPNGHDRELTGIAKLKSKRSVVPAITHVDYSARIQTVDADRHGRYYKLLKSFEQQTGSPVIINTSFNVRGEPIVHTPQQAYRCFMSTNIDALVLERFVLLKEDQPTDKSAEREKYLAEF